MMILAIGGGAIVYFSQLLDAQKVTQYTPEVLMYGYVPLGKRFVFRPGVRFNYSWGTAENPETIKFKQTDFRGFIEAGVMYDWLVMPSLSVGGGVDYRKIYLETKTPIYMLTDDVSSTTALPTVYFQAGLGLPLLLGGIIIEPFARYSMMRDHTQNNFGYGIQVTFKII